MSNVHCEQEIECPFAKPGSFQKAYGEEVNFFMHIHTRGYDKDGEGLQLHSGYYDKYGAPVSQPESWVEGYHVIERLLAKQFDLFDNGIGDFPLVAGMAGGVHLYKDLHNDKPWNWTGWIPRQQKWLCERKFFSNRYFLALRGNEIQNNLWDYHPHEEDEEITEEERDDMVYSQIEPNDGYRGGYFFEGNPFGRYLHVISLRHYENDPALGRPWRYNYIVHPLAYTRRSLNKIPDNGIDAIQWSIINIAKESNFGPESPWGRKCHGLEIFNDFTFSAAYAALVDKTQCYNGTLQTIDGSKTKYIHWFDTYPLEYGEFLLDSALARGVYLHTLTNNDAFYMKITRYKHDQSEEERKVELMNTLVDPKGSMLVRMISEGRGARYEPPESRTRKAMYEKYAKAKEYAELFGEVDNFLSQRPYGWDTVFGYTTLIDTEKRLWEKVFGDQPIPGKGLDEAEKLAMEYLREGNFYSSTGVYRIFDYSACDHQFIPYVIKNQPRPKRMANYIDEEMSMEFTFERCTEKNANLVWRYTIMSETDSNTLETVHGYFKLSSTEKTVLDLTASYNLKKVKWLYFIAINPSNPMRRAWFNAVQGPAFGEPRVDDFNLPDLQHKAFCTTKKCGKLVQGNEMQPMECQSGDLDFLFGKCKSEADDICVYFLQACPLQQDITIAGKTDKSSPVRPPRILQSVHGLFQMHPEHPTRLKLCHSWDKNTVKDGKVYFYEVNKESGYPQKVCPEPAPTDPAKTA